MNKLLKNWISKSQQNLVKFAGKTKTFIKSKVLYIKGRLILPINKLKTLHQTVISIDENTLKEPRVRNAYQLLIDWLVDVIQFGFMCTVAYSALLGWQGYGKTVLLMFGFGMLPDIISHIRNSILGE